MADARTRRIRRRTVLIALALLAALAAGFLLWAGDYYRADDTALAVLRTDTSIRTEDNLTILTPEEPGGTGIIFYPGAKVEAAAYLPLLERLKDRGFTCVLVRMPLNLAIFDANAADGVFGRVPGVEHWFIAGHSMGGAMASDYASRHPDRVEGLILLGAYLYGDYPAAKALTVYGTLNDDLEKHIDYTENIVKIEGGNHAQFGNYGRQKGDPDAAIPAEVQQSIAADAIGSFIAKQEESS